MKGDVDLNFFWLLLALLGGIASFGILGTVLGPLALSLFVAALRGIEARRGAGTAEGPVSTPES
jgi:predicted PurR-regulated permease PerM